MVIELNSNPLSDHTERYRSVGLSLEFLNDVAMSSLHFEPAKQIEWHIVFQ